MTSKPFTVTLKRYELLDDRGALIPALLGSVPAGLPALLSSEAELVNLHKLLTADCPDAQFYRVTGQSMCGEIEDGDGIIVSPSIEPQPGDIVVAMVNGEQTLKYFKLNDRQGRGGLFLVPNNGDFAIRELTQADEVEILAVVVHVISSKRSLRRKAVAV